MALRAAGLETKRRTLSVCVRLFLEQGYKETTIRQIISEANTSTSCFQNLFRAKEGVLTDLTAAMFDGQFAIARSAIGDRQPSIYTYALETAIQLTLTELNENLRELYTEAYSLPITSEYIYEHTTAELKSIFAPYFPGYTESDFYEMDIGSAGLMRSYMARKCDIHFPRDRKIRRFLESSLRIYKVPEEDIQKAIEYINGLDLVKIATDVMERLFELLEMKFDFKLDRSKMK